METVSSIKKIGRNTDIIHAKSKEGSLILGMIESGRHIGESVSAETEPAVSVE